MKALICTLLILVSGVAMAKDQKPTIDADCNRMATNAKAFAELKQGGVATTSDQLAKFVVAPAVQSYPIKAMIQYVLDRDESQAAPDQVYNSLYQKCTLMGYKELLTYFQEREEVDVLKAQLADAQVENVRLKNYLAAQVQQQQTTNTKRGGHFSVVAPSNPPITPYVNNTQTPVGCTKADGTACKH